MKSIPAVYALYERRRDRRHEFYQFYKPSKIILNALITAVEDAYELYVASWPRRKVQRNTLQDHSPSSVKVSEVEIEFNEELRFWADTMFRPPRSV